jgi:ABC-2 type transport system permease protein
MKLLKYFSIAKISIQSEFVYRLNFVMWRVRNILQILIMFFLWSAVYTDPTTNLFGYNQGTILTYVLGVLIVRAIVTSTRTMELAVDINRGDLSNFLLRPIGIFKYYFSRDVASKVLNLSFAAVEIGLLSLIFKPTLLIQGNVQLLVFTVLALVIATILFFELTLMIGMIPFWMPEAGWAVQFLFMIIIVEFLSGGVFPLDVFPKIVVNILHALPFPYLIFFPLQVYLGKLEIGGVIGGLIVSICWTAILYFAIKSLWKKGLMKYASEGR